MPFAHEKLQVYQKALKMVGQIESHIHYWQQKYAFVDHLDRASESVVLNLVNAVRLSKSDKKLRYVDFSYASCLECAACCDIAVIRELLDSGASSELKFGLLEVAKMLAGLRKSWQNAGVAEEGPRYGGATGGPAFYHETLKVYQLSLRFYRECVALLGTAACPDVDSRRMDKYATSVILNIAEGNGRFSVLDRQNFWDNANCAAAKLAAYSDIGVEKNYWQHSAADELKSVLFEIGRMTAPKVY